MSTATRPLSGPGALKNNLRLISLHEVLTSTAPWVVVLALFNWARFDVDGALGLTGIYYLSVVIFEVPSGWASDRFGRVPTLRFVGIAWMAAFTCWTLASDSYLALAIGNILIAAGYASLSGTDVSFHFDTLKALGRAPEYANRQARVVARARIIGTIGALAGGALGLIDLRIPFAISFLLAASQFAVALRFREPPHAGTAARPVEQVRTCVRYLRNVPLRWIFGYGVSLVVLEHVAFNLFTPWLAEALGQGAANLGPTPLVAGLVMAAMGLFGGASAAMSTPVARRVGVRVTLVALGALSAMIVTAMGLFQHLAVLPLAMLRSVQSAAAPVLISAAVAPVVAQRHRATLLSLNSLAGRGLWGSILIGLSSDADSVANTLVRFAAIAWVLVLVLTVSAIAVRRRYGPAEI